MVQALPLLENARTSFTCLGIYAFGLMVARSFLDMLVYVGAQEYPIYLFLLHIPLFYLCVTLSIAAVVSFLSGQDSLKTCKVLFLSLPIILLPPLLDFLIYGAQTRKITYLLDWSGSHFSRLFSVVFLRGDPGTVSWGQVIVVHSVALLSALYVKSKARTLSNAVMAWAIIVVIFYFYLTARTQFMLLITRCNQCLRSICGLEPLPGAQTSLGLLGRIDVPEIAGYLLLLPAVMSILCWLHSKTVCLAIVRNCRIGRLAHYVLLGLLGIVMGVKDMGRLEVLLGASLNPLAIVLFLYAIALAFIGAVWLNDVYDVAIDRISNLRRPLVTGNVTPLTARYIVVGCSLLSLLASYILGAHVLLLMIIIQYLAYLYSVPPFRLRSYFPASSLVIGLINLLVFLSGYALVSGNPIQYPPLRTMIGIGLGFSMLATFKDIKDVEGDLKCGVRTLLTILPRKLGNFLTAALVFLGSIVTCWGVLGGTSGLSVGAACALCGTPAVVLFAAHRESALFGVYLICLVIVSFVYAVS